MKKSIFACICMLLGCTINGMESKVKAKHNLALYKQLNPTGYTDGKLFEEQRLDHIMQDLWDDNIDVRDIAIRERIKQAFLAEQAKLNLYISTKDTKKMLSDDKRMSEITLSAKNNFVARLLSVNPGGENARRK
jgi:hypothetical protein